MNTKIESDKYTPFVTMLILIVLIIISAYRYNGKENGMNVSYISVKSTSSFSDMETFRSSSFFAYTAFNNILFFMSLLFYAFIIIVIFSITVGWAQRKDGKT